MHENILDMVDEELFQDNVDTEIKNNSIYWIDNFGAENEIDGGQIAVNGSTFAWWQKNEVGKELVRIKIKDDVIINWRPPINTMGMGSSGCNFMEFHLEFLVLKYQDKHRERVFVIDTQNINITEIKTEGYTKKIKLIGNSLFVKGIPNGQITETIIHSDKMKTEIIEGDHLLSRNIDF